MPSSIERYLKTWYLRRIEGRFKEVKSNLWRVAIVKLKVNGFILGLSVIVLFWLCSVFKVT